MLPGRQMLGDIQFAIVVWSPIDVDTRTLIVVILENNQFTILRQLRKLCWNAEGAPLFLVAEPRNSVSTIPAY